MIQRKTHMFRKLGNKIILVLSQSIFRKTGKDFVKKNQNLLEPGYYLNIGGTLWKRVGTSVPTIVNRSKGRKGRLTGLLSLVTPRIIKVANCQQWRSSSPQTESHFTSIVSAADDGCVLFDTGHKLIGRTYGFGKISAEQEALRRNWARFVASPSFSLEHDGRFLKEKMIDGVHIHECTLVDQHLVIRKVFSSYAVLVSDAGAGSSAAAVERIFDDHVFNYLNPILQKSLAKPGARDFLSEWPLVPSGSDNSPDNVVVTYEGEAAPCFIDCMPISVSPAFAHSVGVIAAWDNNDVILRVKVYHDFAG
ncbi:MAG: hypothetical protein LAT55_08200 [Opitutales bacterium]|nr:hypothetical protein [Opitutales bacterium]